MTYEHDPVGMVLAVACNCGGLGVGVLPPGGEREDWPMSDEYVKPGEYVLVVMLDTSVRNLDDAKRVQERILDDVKNVAAVAIKPPGNPLLNTGRK